MSENIKAAALANAAEEIFAGEKTSDVFYALAMLVAHAISLSETRDTDGILELLDRSVRIELDRQFSNGGKKEARH